MYPCGSASGWTVLSVTDGLIRCPSSEENCELGQSSELGMHRALLQQSYRVTSHSVVSSFAQDTILAELLQIHKEYIVGYHEHDSLLDHKEEEELTEEERKAAWAEYEAEKKVKLSHRFYTSENNLSRFQYHLPPRCGLGKLIFLPDKKWICKANFDIQKMEVPCLVRSCSAGLFAYIFFVTLDIIFSF